MISSLMMTDLDWIFNILAYAIDDNNLNKPSPKISFILLEWYVYLEVQLIIVHSIYVAEAIIQCYVTGVTATIDRYISFKDQELKVYPQ